MTAFARFGLTRSAALAATLALAACGGGDDSAGTTDSTPQHGTSNTPAPTNSSSDDPAQESLNWAGYVQTGGIGAFSSISGSWIVPDIECGAENQNSSMWLGIGGGITGDPTLIQAGTEQDCRGNDKFFGAWWEALPAPQIPAEGQILITGSYPVSPGDSITVTIGSALVVWDISIVNATQGWTFTTSVPYVAAGDTAEWILEEPLTAGTGGNGQLPLPDFGRAQFSGLTVDGANPMLTSGQRMNMVERDGTVLATPSMPSASGDAFSVCYGAGRC